MAAVSKGMKTVTLGYQSFHSVPCPCLALQCAHRCSHTGATILLYYMLHVPVWPHVNYNMHNGRKLGVLFFFFYKAVIS